MNTPTENLREFDDHQLVSFVGDSRSGLEAFIAIHRGNRQKPSFGATRILSYQSKAEALRDALKLSRLMSYKTALAGLRYGGGKGVIILPAERNARTIREIFKCYAEKVNILNGSFITGADAGVGVGDVKLMRRSSPFIVGLTSNPVKFTALGLFQAIEVAVAEAFGTAELDKRIFAVQGAGQIGAALVQLLYKRAKKIYVADIDPAPLDKIKREFPNVEIVCHTAIHRQKVDVFSPCALGGALNSKTITGVRAVVIAGGANNQLENSAAGEQLHKLGILYAPDYLVNAGGLISVADEYENDRFDARRVGERLNIIGVTLRELLSRSKATGRSLNVLADELAESIFNGE